MFNFELLLDNVIFGFVSYNTKYENEYFLVNLIIFSAKFYIHKCNFAKTKPHFQAFKIELTLSIKTITSSKNKTAAKTLRLCSQCNLLFISCIFHTPLACCLCSFFFLSFSFFPSFASCWLYCTLLVLYCLAYIVIIQLTDVYLYFLLWEIKIWREKKSSPMLQKLLKFMTKTTFQDQRHLLFYYMLTFPHQMATQREWRLRVIVPCALP